MKQVRRNRTGRRGGGTGILALALALWLIAPSAARADCTVQANGTTILVPQTRAAGTIIYNADHHVYQGCQGDKWVLLPVSGGGYDGTCT